MIKTYSELSRLKTFHERFEYLKLDCRIGVPTFGNDRYLNQYLYQNNARWKRVRREVLMRDNSMDLGVDGYEVMGFMIVHHMNPITVDDILNDNPDIFNLEYLISCSHNTHNAIHYGNQQSLIPQMAERSPNDTCPWR